MYQPTQYPNAEYTTLVKQFGGLNRTLAADESEFSELKNMSSDHWPLLSPRKARVTVKTFQDGQRVTGFCNKGALVYCVEENGSTALFVNGRQIDGVSLTAGEKQMVGMGCYACIFPDGYYLNVLDLTDKGYMGQKTEITATQAVPLRLVPCMFDGAAFDNSAVSDSAPADPVNGQVWIDTSGDVAAYNVWDAGSNMWQPMSTVYVKLEYGNIDAGFKQWDGVSLSGITFESEDENLQEQVNALNMPSALIQNCGEGWLSVAALLNDVVEITGTITIERKVPPMDFVTECKNRIWGCRFGVDPVSGQTVNEIYACRQGDFKNWFAYPGVSTDSYSMSIGTDGPFTGAITYLNTPIFFKEDYIHKIYGETPATYQMAQTTARGAGPGQGKSLVTDGSTVFYRSAVDFCAYTGSYPSQISRKLGELAPETVVAGCLKDKLYFYCERETDRELLVFDGSVGQWYSETCDKVHAFVRDGHRLYMLQEDDAGIFRIDAVDGNFGTVLLDENQTEPQEEQFIWKATTAHLGLGQLEAKYVKKVIVRMQIEPGARVQMDVSYDGGDWEQIFDKDGEEGMHIESKSIIPKRCNDMRLRFRGYGAVQILSIAKVTVQGSDKP